MSGWNNIIVKTGIKYGVAGGVLNILFYLTFYFLGRNALLPEIRYVMDVFILILFLTMASIEFWHRDQNYRFWKYMSVGIINYLTLAMVSATFIIVFVYFIAPEYSEEYFTGRLQLMESQKEAQIEAMGEETYYRTFEAIQNNQPYQIAIDDFFKKSMIGLFLIIFISIITVLINERKKIKHPNN